MTPDKQEVGPIQGLTIHQRWNGVLLKLPAIGKDSMNQQQGFKYRSIDAVLDRLNPLFGLWGVHVIPVRQIAEREHRTTAKGNLMNVCYITVDWEIRSVDGEVMFAQTQGEGTDSGDKATSKAQTMALKYLLWPSLAIATNEDPDGTTVEESVSRVSSKAGSAPAQGEIPGTVTEEIVRTSPPPSQNDVATSKQVGYLKKLLDTAGVAPSEWSGIVNKECPPWPDSLSNLSKRQASVLIDLYRPAE